MSNYEQNENQKKPKNGQKIQMPLTYTKTTEIGNEYIKLYLTSLIMMCCSKHIILLYINSFNLHDNSVR